MKFENTQVGDEVILCRMDRGRPFFDMNVLEKLAVVTHATAGLLTVEGKIFIRRTGNMRMSGNWHIKPKTPETLNGLRLFQEKKARQLAN